MKTRLLTTGILFLFLIPLLYSPQALNSFERTKFRFRPGRLIVTEELPEQSFDDENQAYIQGSKANIIVYSIATGYEDKNGQRHFPSSQLSLSQSSKYIIYVDFKVTKNAKVVLIVFFSGPITGEAPDEELIINAKKNVYYQQELIMDLTQENSDGGPVPGLYNILGIVYPAEEELPMSKSGGMTFASMKGEIKK